ncbi:MAG: hypothetical protein A3F89_03945 [Deltaproteobacteria bacterium RIFCSPLOWO2_12_FULL_50_11]|nr:MAG: hypothetical protein A3B79_01215 [Deltaproteobacteria bacterium RIFCSPHIGHO2_02_FULL_50_15]OGQ68277.1 MAG: hypothetical protein A3F89_03945 [Deltaproteobacteria bacterium RIFCSPLOWO2_12_FULL_50_11]
MLLKFDVTAFCFFLAKNFSVFTCLQENYFYFSFNDFAKKKIFSYFDLDKKIFLLDHHPRLRV